MKITLTGEGTLEQIQKDLARLSEALAKKTMWHFEGYIGLDFEEKVLKMKIDRK